MTPQIFAIYFYWHYGPGFKGLLRIWKNFVLFGYNYFSIGILLNTLFSPWHRISSSYGRGFDPMVWTRVFMENMITRLIGAVVRSVVISIGLVVEVFILSIGASLVVIWIFLPLVVPVAIITSLGLIVL